MGDFTVNHFAAIVPKSNTEFRELQLMPAVHSLYTQSNRLEPEYDPYI